MTRARTAVTAAVLLVMAHSTGGAAAWGNIPLGSKIPELTLISTGGRKVKITARGSKATVLLYIRPNHDRSTKALADIVGLYREYAKKGLRAVAVSTARTDAPAIKALAKKLKVPFPVLIDAKETFYGRYGVFIHPTTGVVDAKGVLRYDYSGYRQGYRIAVERQVKAVLGLGPPPDQIKDIDRNAVPEEQRKKRRRERMQEMMLKLERKRARRRLVANRAILSTDTLVDVIQLYRSWAGKMPLPEVAALAVVAEQIRQHKKVAAAVATLRSMKESPERDLWLGRGLVALGQPADQVLRRCIKQGDIEGQCAFELCAVVGQKDTKRGVALCRQALDRLAGD